MSKSVAAEPLRDLVVSERLPNDAFPVMRIQVRKTLARVLSMVAGSFELLYGNMRLFREEYDVPVVVTHGSFTIAAMRSN
jgi:hypothetical protein